MRPAVATKSTSTVVTVRLQAAKARLISEVIALVVVSVTNAVLSNRRKRLQNRPRFSPRSP
jgi:hypothetical protein